ncbi:hypothetical protein SFRURICE_007424 [Spodoptera frugiperda]|nr:hypothetical protein SFRURICE_007424 [Spodoptera frugiperda]
MGVPVLHTAYVFFESGCDVAASFPDVTRATVARSNRHHRHLLRRRYSIRTIFRHPVNYGTYYARLRIRIHWQFPGVKNRDTHTSAVAEHACSAGTAHFLRFDKVSVLAREKYFVPRKVTDGGWALPPAWKPSLQSASTYNVAGLECDTVSAVCNTVFAPTRESNLTPAQPPANESNEPTSSRGAR